MAKNEELEPLLPTSALSGSQKLAKDPKDPSFQAEDRVLASKSPGKTPSNPALRLPKRTTKTSQKLTLFPEDIVAEFDDAKSDFEPPAATLERTILGNVDRRWLPQVSAYCTATSYDMDRLLEHLRRKNYIHNAAPRRFDEVIYTPFSMSAIDGLEAQKAGIPNIESSGNYVGQGITQKDFNLQADSDYVSDVVLHELAKKIAPIGEIMYFEYGVVVLWGFSADEEQEILKDLRPFESGTFGKDAIVSEQFYFHYNAIYQPRIYNDIITLKNPGNYMLKICIAHAIAQSVKLTLFEGLIEETIESTRSIPRTMAREGKFSMSRRDVNKKIGELFIMRINVNLVSNVLDTPEIFWSEPSLEPLYQAIRGYLEISQRVELLNLRVRVISDLLDMLKEHLTSHHGEYLEWIVIVLIGFEILIGIITITIDLASIMKKG